MSAEAAIDVARSLQTATDKDPKGLWRFLQVVGVTAILAALAFGLWTRDDRVDRFTGADAAREFKIRDDMIANLRESMIELKSTLRSIEARLGRIETKLDK